MMKLYTSILVALLLSFSAVANNVRVNGKLIPGASPEGLVQLSFSISWDNAWNDPYNWDAVWAFVKYRKKTDAGEWKHGYLAASGHTATGVNISPGMNDDLVVGTFLFPVANGTQDIEDKGVTLVLSDAVLAQVSMEEVLAGDVDFSIQLIEMVLVPEGSFYAGDGVSARSIASVDNPADPALISSESGLSLQLEAGKVNLSDFYPKGYAGFYVMKYELSQAQYVDFLNKLSRDQQQLPGRVPDLPNLKPGDYIFGQKDRPNARNGIVVYINEPDRPAVFACNLTRDDRYNAEDDGLTLACNYISPWEMMNYCDWAGLRPMSELEYEKACRKPFPELPTAGEYAWNTTVFTPLTGESDVVNPYTDGEYVTDAAMNVNCSNTTGPLRCGAFAFHPSGVDREKAGATCSGLMEMSGNLREMCYTAEAGLRYQKSIADYLGDGELNVSGVTNVPDNFWPKLPVNFIPRGGGFSSDPDELRISDRSLLEYITDGQLRDSTLGFRAVRNVPAPGTYIDAGKVVGANGKIQDTLCSNHNVITYQVLNDRLPAFIGDVGGVRFNYQWYLRKGEEPWQMLSGENNATLNYQDAFVNTTGGPLAYQFRRDVVFPGGTVASPVMSVWVLNINPAYSAREDRVDACDIATGITVTVETDAHFSWELNGWPLASNSGKSSTYRARRNDFRDYPDASPYQVVCQITAGKCSVSQQFDITVETATADPADCPCGATIMDEDGNEYPTVQIGNQCWMAKNLNTGIREDLANLDQVYATAGVQKGCYGDQSSNCRAYGGMYPWWEVICGGECSSAFTATAQNTPGVQLQPNFANGVVYSGTMEGFGVKYSANKKYIQGICPSGWHLPSNAEWQQLERQIGMVEGSITALNSWDRKMVPENAARGLLQEVSGDDAWCNGDGCNSTGFSAYYGGYIDRYLSTSKADVIGNDKESIAWWSASVYGSNMPTTTVHAISVGYSAAIAGKTVNKLSALPVMGLFGVYRNSYMYVRCMKDY